MGIFQQIIEWDKELFLFFNGFHNDFWDTIMLMITRKETWLPFYLVIIYYFIKNYRKKTWMIMLFLAITIVASDQVSVLIKETVQRLRPVYEPGIESLAHNVLRKGGHYGFVSSHAANTFAIFVFTSRIFKNRWYSLLLLVWAIVVSYSRIYSGVHYPLDIIGGALVGWGVGYAFFKVLMFVENHFFLTSQPRIEKNNLPSYDFGIIVLVLLVLLSTVFITSGILHYYSYL